MDYPISSTPISGSLTSQTLEIFSMGVVLNRVLTFTLQVAY